MAYEEYDYYNEPFTGSLKESLREILYGLQDKTKLREAGTSLKEALQLTPNITESLARGGVGQAIGTSGDLRELRNTINSYLPKSIRNMTQAAEFLANPYATVIQQTAPTTEETLDFVPRATAPYEGYKQHETLGEYIAPSLGYFGGKAAKAYGNYVGPTAYKAVEDYMTKTGGILNAVEPSEAKKIQESAIDELGFHSPLENAILKIQQPKGTGDQFLKQLEKTPGVKTEELDVTGVKQYLLDHPTVTKQELLDYMGQNRLKLEQKVLGEPTGDIYDEYRLSGGDVYHDDEYIRGLADDLHYDLKNDDVIRSQERQALLEADPERYADYDTNPYSQARLEEDIDGVLYEQAKQQANEMYYENPITHHYDNYGYDIYGNDENGYSFKSPNGEFLNIGNRNGIYDISDAEQALREHHLDNGIIDIDGGGAKYEDYTLPGKYTNYREVLTTLPEKQPGLYPSFDSYFKAKYSDYADPSNPAYSMAQNDAKRNWDAMGGKIQIDDFSGNKVGLSTGNYQSSHYDEPNILAHTRLNDRIINGKKTLMVEEIQSDWHQAGRRKGYQTGNPIKELHDYEGNLPTRAREAIKAEALKNGLSEAQADKMSTTMVRTTDFNGMANYLDEMDKYTEIAQKAFNKDKLVPDAPFKKNWHELMIKQILNEAVKGNYDAVAFTTGKQQAERYSLSKQISGLSYMNDGVLRAFDKNGNTVINKKLNSPDELEDYIGKEAAKKLMEKEPEDLYVTEYNGQYIAHGNPNVFKGRELSGIDLDVGGEGMKGFYDKILPDFINKYGKKYGIAVKKENLPSERLPSQEGVDNYLKSINMSRQEFDKLSLDERAKILSEASPKGEEVHYFDLSDMAKKDIKEKGQPLFSGIGLAAPALMPEDQDKTKK
jgi:hypothetical protein